MNRIVWMDISKGLGILLVIAYHTFEGILNSFEDTQAVQSLAYFFRNWLMPMFFLVSGLAVSKGLPKYSRVKNKNKILDWVYLYIVWSFIIYTVRILSNSFSNTQMNLNEIFFILWNPVPTIWFIYALLLSFITAILFRKLNRLIVVFVGFSLSLINLYYFSNFETTILQRYCWVVVFYLIGVRYSHEILSVIQSKQNLLFSSLFIVLGPIAAFFKTQIPLGFMPFISLILSIGFICIVWRFANINFPFVIPVQRFLAYAGSISIFIYLTHFPLPALTRIILLRLEVYSFTMNVLSAIALSVVVAVISVSMANRFKVFSVLFNRPKQ